MARDKEKAKQRYKELRAAGFSKQDAERLRYASDEKYNKALKTHKAPAKDVSKAHRAKVKPVKTEYINSSLVEIPINPQLLYNPNYMKSLNKLHTDLKAQGFHTVSGRVEHYFKNYEPEMKASPMQSIHTYPTVQGFLDELTSLANYFFEYYDYVNDRDYINAKLYLLYWKSKPRDLKKPSRK